MTNKEIESHKFSLKWLTSDDRSCREWHKFFLSCQTMRFLISKLIYDDCDHAWRNLWNNATLESHVDSIDSREWWPELYHLSYISEKRFFMSPRHRFYYYHVIFIDSIWMRGRFVWYSVAICVEAQKSKFIRTTTKKVEARKNGLLHSECMWVEWNFQSDKKSCHLQKSPHRNNFSSPFFMHKPIFPDWVRVFVWCGQWHQINWSEQFCLCISEIACGQERHKQKFEFLCHKISMELEWQNPQKKLPNVHLYEVLKPYRFYMKLFLSFQFDSLGLA